MLGVFIVTDWQEIQNVILAAEWKLIPVAILFTIISYACISYSFAVVSRTLGVKAGQTDLAAIGYVTTVINHVVTSGGVVGYSLRYLLMKQHGISMKKVFTVSVLHFYMTSMVMLGMLPIALATLFSLSTLSTGLSVSLIVAAIIVVLVFFFMTVLVFSESIRSKLMVSLSRIFKALSKRDIEFKVEDFHASLSSGVKALRDQPWRAFSIFALVVVDWLTSAGALWFSFEALGEPVGPAVLMTGFVIGILAGVLSMIPGGIGIQEGSMAGIFALLGVPIEQALLAAVLFRVIYYLLPYLVGLVVFARISRQSLVESRMKVRT
jgi:uncharacterized protein (TIRG00374 family)